MPPARSTSADAPAEPAAASGRRARGVAIGLTLAACALLLFECRSVPAQIDDAYISYRYAANLVDGLGLVYNAGERVEGYTNLLFTLLVAAGLLVSDDAERVGHALGVASGLGLLVATASLAWAALPTRRRMLAGLAPWLLLSHPALVRWSESGMESALFAALATAALAAEIRGRATWALVACSLATLTRPEGVLLTAIVLAPRWLREARAGRLPVAPVLAYAGLLAALTGFRLLYYGSPLPNTFYAKITPQLSLRQGLGDVAGFLAQGLFLLLPAAAASLVWDRRGLPGAVWAVACLLYLLAIGGDTIGPTRFLLPVLPPLCVLALAGAVRGVERRPALGLALALLAAAGLAWQVVPLPTGDPERGLASLRARELETVRDACERARALVAAKVRRLARVRPRVRLVAASGIGYLGYASRLPLIDLLGLTDAEIARTPLREGPGALPIAGHRRSNADSVLARRPDYILIGPAPQLLQAHRDLLAHPDFERLYCWDGRVRAYARCDRLAGSRQAPAAQRPARRPKKEPSPSERPLL